MTDASLPPGDDAERALRDGLRAKALSPEALERIRRATEAEWRQSVAMSSPPRRRAWPLALAASVVALIAVGIYLGGTREVTAEFMGTVARAESPGIAQRQWFGRALPLSEGARLRVPQDLEARGDTRIDLAGGGNLRVARASAFEVVATNKLRLERGELYVDIPPGARGSDAFTVLTDEGEFRHEGTQFSVAVGDRQTRLRVREGRVRWHGAAGDTVVVAGTELTIDPRGERRRDLASTGREWAWTEALAPEIDIENRPLREFLDWFARETGRTLVIDAAARAQSEQIRMHGSIRGLTAIEALSAVMAATTLRYELPEGAIRVSSPRDSRPTR
jgi:ferric-dicitrate binding protein FerR (iron transport regulator)